MTPTAAEILAIKPGDYITFRAATRTTNAKAKRKVTKAYDEHRQWIEVKYYGWTGFAVKPSEIIEIHSEN